MIFQKLLLIYSFVILFVIPGSNLSADEFCGVTPPLQAGFSDPLQAAETFQFEMESSGCALRSVLGSAKNQNLILLGYDYQNSQFRYMLVDKTTRPPTQKICTVSSHIERVLSENSVTNKEIFSQPHCL